MPSAAPARRPLTPADALAAAAALLAAPTDALLDVLHDRLGVALPHDALAVVDHEG